MSDIELPYIVHSGGRSDLELKRNGYGEFPNGYELTPYGLATVATWMQQNQNQDPEECNTCTTIAAGGHPDYCPYHKGIITGINHAITQMKNLLEEL